MPVLIVIEQPHGQEGDDDNQQHENKNIPAVFSYDFIHRTAFQSNANKAYNFSIQCKGGGHIENIIALYVHFSADNSCCSFQNFLMVKIFIV